MINRYITRYNGRNNLSKVFDEHVSMKWALGEMALLQEVFSTKWFSRQSVVQQSVSGAVRAMSFNVKIEQST